MKKIRRTIIIILLFVSLSVLISYIFYAETEATAEQGDVNISVVLYEGVDDQWIALNQGIEQACIELGINAPIALLSDPNDPESQIDLINQSINEGTQGLLLAFNHTDTLTTYQTLSENLPAVSLNPVGGQSLATVALDDRALASTLLSGQIQEEKSVIILKENTHRESTQIRFEVMRESLLASGKDVIVWERKSGNEEDEDLNAFLRRQFESTPYVSVLALDVEGMEALINAALQTDALPRLYGFGSSEKILYYIDRNYIDRGYVTEICYEDYYALGFNAVVTLANSMNISSDLPIANVSSFLVHKDNLYDEDLAQSLFPVIR